MCLDEGKKIFFTPLLKPDEQDWLDPAKASHLRNFLERVKLLWKVTGVITTMEFLDLYFLMICEQ